MVSFALLRLVKLGLGGGWLPIVTPDSGTYRLPNARWLDLTAVLEAKRPFVMTITYAFLPNDEFRVMLQALIFTVCWSFLLIAVYITLNRPAVRTFGLLAFWLLGLSALTSQWDVLILSESLTISMLTASIAATLVWLYHRKPVYLLSAISLLLVAALIRPQLFIVVAFLTIAWWSFGRVVSSSTASYAAAGGLLTVGLILAIGQQFLNDARLSTDQLVSRTTWIYTNSLLPGSPFAERLSAQLPESAPACIKPVRPLGDTAGQFLIDEYRSSCPEGLVWVKSDFRNFYLLFLISDPIATATDTGRLLWDSTAIYLYGLGSEIGPDENLTSLFAFDQSRKFLIGFIVSATTALMAWPYVRRQVRQRLTVISALVVAFGLSWVGALLLQIADLHRTSVTSIVPINILLLAVFLIALEGITQKTRPDL